MVRSLRVVVVDRCPIAAEGFRSVLTGHGSISVVGIAHNATGALREAVLSSPDVVLLDLDLGADNGVELIATLVKRCLHSAVLVVSDQTTRLAAAVRAGARGFVVKTTPVEEILRAVRQVAAGSTPVSARLLPLLLSEVCDQRHRALTVRELEVLQLVAIGRTNAEIAKILFLSEATVKTHLRRIFGKLQVSDRASAVATAIATGGLVPVQRAQFDDHQSSASLTTLARPGDGVTLGLLNRSGAYRTCC
ncbi:MAG: LuxR C-terminal-related transcriptional regulator [Pseudonocardiaceae bacterium]